METDAASVNLTETVEVSVEIESGQDKYGKKFLMIDKHDCDEWQQMKKAVEVYLEETKRRIGLCH